MKYIRTVFAILLILTLMLNVKDVFAMDTGFSTEPLSEADKNNFLSNANISILDTEPKKEAIECFDVNEEGMIAIGSGGSVEKTIAIYDMAGSFQYGYKFNTYGSFGVEWDKNKIIIYFVRSDVAVALSSAGEVESILKILDTSENNSYWNSFVLSPKRTVGRYEYILKNDMGVLNFFTSSYSQLVAIDSAGESNVLYDVNLDQMYKTILIFAAVVLAIGITIFAIVRECIKWNQQRYTEKTDR